MDQELVMLSVLGCGCPGHILLVDLLIPGDTSEPVQLERVTHKKKKKYLSVQSPGTDFMSNGFRHLEEKY